MIQHQWKINLNYISKNGNIIPKKRVNRDKCDFAAKLRMFGVFAIDEIRVWRIFGYSNIFEYFPIRIFVRIIFVSFFWCKYIQIFVRIVFLIRIYSDIRSYHFFDTNIFGYSFVSFFGYKYIRIFVRIENLYSPYPGPYLIIVTGTMGGARVKIFCQV